MQTQQNYDTEHLGPLSQLVGSWEGDKGYDVMNTHSVPTEKAYHESITFEPVGPIKNGSHELFGLRYTTLSWPNGTEEPFHQELGYWLWSPEDHQVVRCFTNQNGVTVHAGGQCDTDSQHFEMSASADSDEYGISSCPTLNDGCKTLSYNLKMDMLNDKQFSYSEEYHLKNSLEEDVIIHTDKNAMTKLY